MSVPIVPSSDLQSLIAATATEFPFKVELSLGPLIDFWTKEMPRAHPVKGVLARMVEEELRKAPELREPIEDRPGDRPRSSFQDALRLTLRGRGAGGRGAAPPRSGAPARPSRRPSGPDGASPARPLRAPRLHRAEGGGGDRPGGALVAQAGPDRQRLDQ